MWSEKFKLTDIREIDKTIREIMNQVNAKYSLQMNASLYLPRRKGGRGLRKLETIYKTAKIKAAMNLLTGTYPRIKCVKDFDKDRMAKKKISIIKDAVKYSEEDFNISFTPLEDDYIVKIPKSRGNDINVRQKFSEKDP